MAERSTAIGRFEKNTGTSALTGTASSSGTTVTGTTTAFDTELRTGDAIKDNAGTEYRTVVTIASATSLTIDSAFTTALSAATLDKATFTEIPQVSSLTGLSGERSEVEVSSWSSGIDRKFLLGRRDPGSAELPLWFDAKTTAHTDLRTDQTNDTERTWRAYIFDSAAGTAIPDASNSVITFRGRVQNFPVDFPDDGALGGTLTIRVSGPVTVAAGVDP